MTLVDIRVLPVNASKGVKFVAFGHGCREISVPKVVLPDLGSNWISLIHSSLQESVGKSAVRHEMFIDRSSFFISALPDGNVTVSYKHFAALRLNPTDSCGKV